MLLILIFPLFCIQAAKPASDQVQGTVPLSEDVINFVALLKPALLCFFLQIFLLL